jgi:hypothetical protein
MGILGIPLEFNSKLNEIPLSKTFENINILV